MKLPWFAFKDNNLTINDAASNPEGGDPGSTETNNGPEVIPTTSKDDKALKSKNLADSIKDALEQAGKLHEPKEESKLKTPLVTAPAPKPKEAAKKEEPKETKKEDSDDLTAEELTAFKNLKSLLNDKETAPETIRLLAKKAGVNLDAVETKKEQVAAKKTILETLKENLPEEMQYLADILAPGLAKVIKSEVEDEVKDLKEYKTRTEVKEIENEISLAVTGEFKKFSNSNEIEQEVFNLMSEVPKDPKISHAKYFQRLITLAAAEKGLVLIKTDGEAKPKVEINNERVNKNRTDAASRLASERGSEVKTGTEVTSKKMNLNDAVKDAVEQATKLFNT